MSVANSEIVEIKSRCSDLSPARAVLTNAGADFVGTDRQVDTYFNSPRGRLKLREGNIETSLIHYFRDDQAAPKHSLVSLYRPLANRAALKAALTAAMGVKVVVAKTREIYFIENVKFHLDVVDSLDGFFVEIEAISCDTRPNRKLLQVQCEHFMQLLDIDPLNLVTYSYSDLLMRKGL